MMPPTTRVWFDTEFLEDGHTIDLISLGAVRQDGAEYYAVSAEFDVDAVRQHAWLSVNVWPHLPLIKDAGSPEQLDLATLDRGHPDVKPRTQIRDEFHAFLTGGPHEPRLFAYYSAYDHVAYAQLWGPMAVLPDGLPKRTGDIAQLAEDLGSPELPTQAPGTEHHALHDARHDRTMHEFLLHHASAQLRPRAVPEDQAGLSAAG